MAVNSPALELNVVAAILVFALAAMFHHLILARDGRLSGVDESREKFRYGVVQCGFLQTPQEKL